MRRLQLSSKIAAATVASWRKRNSVPYEHAVRLAMKYPATLDWLLLGKGNRLGSIFVTPPGDIELMLVAVEAIESGWGQVSEPGVHDALFKARHILMFYGFCVSQYEALMATGQFTRANAIARIGKDAAGWFRQAF